MPQGTCLARQSRSPACSTFWRGSSAQRAERGVHGVRLVPARSHASSAFAHPAVLKRALGCSEEDVELLSASFREQPEASEDQMLGNIQALRKLGLSVGQTKSLVLACPRVLTAEMDIFLKFMYSYGASPKACSCSCTKLTHLSRWSGTM